MKATVMLTLRVPFQVARDLKREARTRDCSVNWLVALIVRDYLDAQAKDAEK